MPQPVSDSDGNPTGCGSLYLTFPLCHPRGPAGPVCVMECNAIREFHTLFCDFSAG